MTLNGADVSAFQPGNIFDLVNVDFGLVKATQGVDYVSHTCNQQYGSLKSKGKLRGTYHFADPGDARAQANYYVQQIKGYIGDGVHGLDYEGSAVRQGGAWAALFLTEFHNLTGVVPFFYASESVARTCPEVAAAGFWLWNANYGLNNDRTFRQPGNYPVGSFPFQTIRQYSSVGNLPGYGASLDLDAAYIDAAGWAKLASVGGSVVQPVASVGAAPGTGASSATRTVANEQLFLNVARGEKLGVDGLLGPLTEAAIARYQTFLRAYGYAGAIDGIWGAGTQAAHDKYYAVWSAPKAAPVASGRPSIARGASGQAVKDLQARLNRDYPLYSHLVVDGIFGPGTDSVVREFQKRAGLVVDGIVGPATWGKLGF